MELNLGTHERKEREKEHRREEILDAAQRIFFEKGLQLATMDEIAETAELSKGTLYLYYKSKEDLYLAVMMRGLEVLHQRFAKVVQNGQSAASMIVALNEAYVTFFEDHREYFRMLHYHVTPQFHRNVSEDMKISCNTLNQTVWNLVFGILQRGINEGFLRKDLNPAEVGVILWSSSTALMLRIDSEYATWKEGFHIDLIKTLRLSNTLLFDSLCTEAGRKTLKTIANI